MKDNMCIVFDGNVVVPIGKLAHVRFHSPSDLVVRNSIMLVLEGKLTCVRIHSWRNVFDGNVVVPVGRKTHVSFHSPCNVVVINAHVFVLVGNLTWVSFHSLNNVVVRNLVVLFLEGQLTCARFPS